MLGFDNYSCLNDLELVGGCGDTDRVAIVVGFLLAIGELRSVIILGNLIL